MPTEALLFSVLVCSALALLMFVVLTPGPMALLTCVRAAWNLRGQQVSVALNRNYAQRYGDTVIGPCRPLKAAAIGWLWCGEWPRGGARIMPHAEMQLILQQDPYRDDDAHTLRYFGLTVQSRVTGLRIVN